jgi:hypothetical protein
MEKLTPDIINVIRSRIMEWAGYVELMGEMRNSHIMLVGRSEGNNHSSGLLRWVLRK